MGYHYKICELAHKTAPFMREIMGWGGFYVQKILCGYICKSLIPESIHYFPFIKESPKAEKKNKSGTTESYEVPKGAL